MEQMFRLVTVWGLHLRRKSIARPVNFLLGLQQELTSVFQYFPSIPLKTFIYERFENKELYMNCCFSAEVRPLDEGTYPKSKSSFSYEESIL